MFGAISFSFLSCEIITNFYNCENPLKSRCVHRLVLQFSVSLSGGFGVCDDDERLLPRLGRLAARLAQQALLAVPA